jgi:hypothetical protein
VGILPSVLFTLQSKVAGHERDGRDDPGIVPDLCDGSKRKMKSKIRKRTKSKSRSTR